MAGPKQYADDEPAAPYDVYSEFMTREQFCNVMTNLPEVVVRWIALRVLNLDKPKWRHSLTETILEVLKSHAKERTPQPQDHATVNAMFDSVDVDGLGRISFGQFREGRKELPLHDILTCPKMSAADQDN